MLLLYTARCQSHKPKISAHSASSLLASRTPSSARRTSSYLVCIHATMPKAKTAAKAAQAAAKVAEDAPPTLEQKLNFYFLQHMGLVCVIVGVALVYFGYDQGWMHNTTLLLLSLAICLVGLFFHEFRPYNAEQIYKDLQAQRGQEEAEKMD